MTKHFELIVPRPPVRDADRAPRAARSAGTQPAAMHVGQLVPVHAIPGLTLHERAAELRLRVQSGVYARDAVAEQVARAMLSSDRS